ncbi:MAG TPA: cytochrome c [Chloroflexota bacterium]
MVADRQPRLALSFRPHAEANLGRFTLIHVIGILELVVAIVLAIVFGWLCLRAWHRRNLAIRIVLGLIATVLTVVLALVSIVGVVGAYRLYAPHGGPPANVTAQAPADVVAAAGRRANGCTGCHSSTGDLPLDGGSDNFLGGPLGTLYAPNLTQGGPLKDWTDGEIVRAIREGVDRDGHPLIIMPSDAFHFLSDADVQALVAFLRSQPASTHTTPARDLGIMALVLIGGGLFPTAEQPLITQSQSAPPPGVSAAYGKYLVDITGCRLCHGQTLEGGAPGGFGPPPGPGLRALVPTWQEAAFISFFRTGVDPYDRAIDPNEMPWKDIGKAYSDDELRAMYAYIKSPN